METGRDATETLRDVVADVIEQARRVPEVPNNQHHQIITLHHGDPPKPAPWHSWVCLTACLLMLLMTIGMGVMYLELRSEQRRTQDHMSVIYQLIPDLRKMVNEELCRQRKLENCKIVEK